MGATGGFFGGGGKEIKQTTTQTEQGQQVADQGSAVNLSFTGKNSGGRSTIIFNETDAGAVQNAFDFSGDILSETTKLLDETQNNAFTFSGGALTRVVDLADRSRNDAFLFSAGVLENSRFDNAEQSANIISFGKELNDRSLETLDKGVQGIFNTVDSLVSAQETATNDNLLFAAGALDRTISFSESVNADAIGAVDRAITQGLAFGDRALQVSDQARLDALEFGAGAFETAADKLADSTSNTLSSLASAQDKTITAIGEQTRSDASKSFDNLVKITGIAIAVVSAVFLFRGKSA